MFDKLLLLKSFLSLTSQQLLSQLLLLIHHKDVSAGTQLLVLTKSNVDMGTNMFFRFNGIQLVSSCTWLTANISKCSLVFRVMSYKWYLVDRMFILYFLQRQRHSQIIVLTGLYPRFRVQNYTFLVANATKNRALATRISCAVPRQPTLPQLTMMIWLTD